MVDCSNLPEVEVTFDAGSKELNTPGTDGMSSSRTIGIASTSTAARLGVSSIR